MPSLRTSAMRDVFDIMNDHNLYVEGFHNKTENEYKRYNKTLGFLSVDDPQKVRGRKRRILWMNEANEFTAEEKKQLFIRTTDKIILDFNPSDEYHWIYDEVLTRDDVVFVQSTWRDNSFLEQSVIDEIERLKLLDANAYRIFGLGERGVNDAAIYPSWELCSSVPTSFDAYGLDFGYNNPSALVGIKVNDNSPIPELIWHELLYRRHLTVSDLQTELKPIVEPGVPIYADNADPDKIEALNRAGFLVYPADKSVTSGISSVKSHALKVTKESSNLQKELRSYKYMKDKNGIILEQPVKFMDHAVDAGRYGTYTHLKTGNFWFS